MDRATMDHAFQAAMTARCALSVIAARLGDVSGPKREWAISIIQEQLGKAGQVLRTIPAPPPTAEDEAKADYFRRRDARERLARQALADARVAGAAPDVIRRLERDLEVASYAE